MREFRGYFVKLAMTELSSHDACGVIEESVLGLTILDIEICGALDLRSSINLQGSIQVLD